MDLKVNELKSFDRKLSKNLSGKYLNDGLSKLAKNQLADIEDQDNRMFNSLLKNVNKFQKENKTLREQNKNLRIELERIKFLLKNAQKDVESSKEKYKLLIDNNKSLLNVLKNKLTNFKLDKAGHSEETQKHISFIRKKKFN